MSIAWGYEGRRVVVSGGGGAGMGAALVDDLVELGAEVHVLDVKDSSAEVAGYHKADLRDPAAIDAAVESIGGPVHALFNCAGLPGKPHSGMDTMLVNFVAARHLTERVAPLMEGGGAVATISSAGGIGWDRMRDVLGELVATDGYDGARAWLEARPELVGEGYLLSKQAIDRDLNAALNLAAYGRQQQDVAGSGPETQNARGGGHPRSRPKPPVKREGGTSSVGKAVTASP